MSFTQMAPISQAEADRSNSGSEMNPPPYPVLLHVPFFAEVEENIAPTRSAPRIDSRPAEVCSFTKRSPNLPRRAVIMLALVVVLAGLVRIYRQNSIPSPHDINMTAPTAEYLTPPAVRLGAIELDGSLEVDGTRSSKAAHLEANIIPLEDGDQR